VVLGRSLVFSLDFDWEARLEEMNRSKMGRPFVCPDPLMGGIAYLQYMIGRRVRIMGGPLTRCWQGHKGPRPRDHMEADLAQTVSIGGDRITIKAIDDKMHVLVAGSTGITTAGKGR